MALLNQLGWVDATQRRLDILPPGGTKEFLCVRQRLYRVISDLVAVGEEHGYTSAVLAAENGPWSLGHRSGSDTELVELNGKIPCPLRRMDSEKETTQSDCKHRAIVVSSKSVCSTKRTHEDSISGQEIKRCKRQRVQ